MEAMRLSTQNGEMHKRFLKEIFIFASELDFSQSPPTFAQKIHRRLREITGVKDPYSKLKQSFNRLALEMFSAIESLVKNSPDPLETAVRFAIAGNIIDSGAKSALRECEIKEALEATASMPLTGDFADFKKAVRKAVRILYLADNAGEIVFDRLLLDLLPRKSTVLAVRGAPVINDATLSDAETAGINNLVNVISNGSDAPGTIIEDCSKEFVDCFRDADLIISKGQGNYETLSHRKENIFFLLKVKCTVIESHIGFPVGTHLLLKNKNE